MLPTPHERELFIWSL